jgi:hypothetical protein
VVVGAFEGASIASAGAFGAPCVFAESWPPQELQPLVVLLVLVPQLLQPDSV